MSESEEELKSLLIKDKEESEKVSLKLNIQKPKIMANRWRNNIDSDRLCFWVLQMVTAVMKLKDACSLESYDQPRQHIKKQRLVCQRSPFGQAVFFPVVIYGCEIMDVRVRL